MLRKICILLMASTVSAMYGCAHAEVGDEEGMLQEANCLFHRSDINKDGELSHQSTRQFVTDYLESEEIEERVIQDIERDYGTRISKDEFYGVFGYMKYHEAKIQRARG